MLPLVRWAYVRRLLQSSSSWQNNFEHNIYHRSQDTLLFNFNMINIFFFITNKHKLMLLVLRMKNRWDWWNSFSWHKKISLSSYQNWLLNVDQFCKLILKNMLYQIWIRLLGKRILKYNIPHLRSICKC